ncbi:hypothetical protein E5676_scaffold1161G00330 [Cucumis melo var. makuwa]|uniref:Uncharacterized protein n=1 Tax=Cucumis melo var. makuwa TaxID=1194695 RepID=A0A5D3BV69_CUCMM|nr:hypothetical protein E5676_scaffold1161G00330 [Cucumis melo var. makuwa]
MDVDKIIVRKASWKALPTHGWDDIGKELLPTHSSPTCASASFSTFAHCLSMIVASMIIGTWAECAKRKVEHYYETTTLGNNFFLGGDFSLDLPFPSKKTRTSPFFSSVNHIMNTWLYRGTPYVSLTTSAYDPKIAMQSLMTSQRNIDKKVDHSRRLACYVGSNWRNGDVYMHGVVEAKPSIDVVCATSPDIHTANVSFKASSKDTSYDGVCPDVVFCADRPPVFCSVREEILEDIIKTIKFLKERN